MSAKTLVVTTGALLRVRPVEGSESVALEVVEPCRRPKTWRVVCEEDVSRHAAEWAAERGISATPGRADARGSASGGSEL